MNKYQEALETIGKTYTDDCQIINEWEEYKLLQELIDNYNQISHYPYEYEKLYDKYVAYSKALDKARKENAELKKELDMAREYIDGIY